MTSILPFQAVNIWFYSLEICFPGIPILFYQSDLLVFVFFVLIVVVVVAGAVFH